MCDDDAIRELKQEIAAAHKDGTHSVSELSDLYRVLWDLCPHTTLASTEDSGARQCTCCGKLFYAGVEY